MLKDVEAVILAQALREGSSNGGVQKTTSSALAAPVKSAAKPKNDS
jgi:hypothetical protein